MWCAPTSFGSPWPTASQVQSCSVVGTDVLVTVTARAGTGPFAGTGTGRARAGPVDVMSAA